MQGVIFSRGGYLSSVVQKKKTEKAHKKKKERTADQVLGDQDISMPEVNRGFLGKFELTKMLLWYKFQLSLNQGEGRNMSQHIIH